MRRITSTGNDDASPRPIGQSFWLFITMALAVAVVMVMGDAWAEAQRDGQRPSYSGQELLELVADSTTETQTDSGNADPASPTATSTQPDRETESPLHTHDHSPRTTADTADSAPVAWSVEQAGQDALATISYPWEQLLPEWTITFLPEKRGLYGLTKVPEERIEIYVRDNQSLELLAHVIAHELGHAVDVTLNDGPDRRRWEESRGLSSSPWWPGSGATDFSTGAGDFAESFAAWQVGDQSFRSELGGAPTAAQIELLAELSAG